MRAKYQGIYAIENGGWSLLHSNNKKELISAILKIARKAINYRWSVAECGDVLHIIAEGGKSDGVNYRLK